MASKTTLCAVALLLCAASLYAMPRLGCQCIRTTTKCIPFKSVRKIEVIPVSGYCRSTEIKFTTKKQHVVCVNPDMPCVQKILATVQSMNHSEPSNTQL